MRNLVYLTSLSTRTFDTIFAIFLQAALNLNCNSCDSTQSFINRRRVLSLEVSASCIRPLLRNDREFLMNNSFLFSRSGPLHLIYLLNQKVILTCLTILMASRTTLSLCFSKLSTDFKIHLLARINYSHQNIFFYRFLKSANSSSIFSHF